MTRRFALAVALLGLSSAVMADAPAKSQKPIGAWERTADGRTISFKFDADNLRCTLSLGAETIQVDAAYGLTADGVIFGSITKVEKKGTDGGPSERELFSFRIARSGDTLTLSELMGTHVSDDAKQLLHGDYKKTAGK